MSPLVMGVDLSLTATGVSDGSACYTLTPDKERGNRRMQVLRQRLYNTVRYADLCVVEGPAFGAKNQQMMHESAGWWWIATYMLWRAEIPVAVASPAEVKKYGSGRGNAKKEDMRVAVDRRFPEVTVTDNNQADALVLAAMGYDHLGVPLVKMPEAHRVALVKVAWPT